MSDSRTDENRGEAGEDVFGIRKTELFADVAILAFTWFLAALLVDPVGEFPLNDDWAFAITVKRLLEQGTFRPHDWLSMTFLTQALWGAFAAKLFGFSYTTLRLSSAFLGFVCLVTVYLLARELGALRNVALFASLVVGFNPLYLGLSHTFMTDIPFLTASMLGVLFYVRFLRTDSNMDWGVGTFWVLAAVLSRQLGLFLPLGFAGAVLLQRRFWNVRGVVRAVVPIVIGLAAMQGLRFWLEARHALPAIYERQRPLVLKLLLAHPIAGGKMLLDQINTELVYVALFLLPCLILVPASRRLRRIQPSVVVVLAAIVSFATVLIRGRRMPLRGNILTESGLGPSTLRDGYILGLAHEPRLPDGFWMLVTALGIISAGLLVARVVWVYRNSIRHRDSSGGRLREAHTFLLLTALVYAAVMSIFPQFDRYFLPLVPILGVAILGPPASRVLGGRLAWSVALCAWFAMGAFSVAATRDYLAWNRARWVALRDLTEKEAVSPHRIDGGPEFNGIYLYDPRYEKHDNKSWWWVDDDEYVIARGPLDGYEIARRYPITRWMPGGRDEIVVLHRLSKSTGG